MNRKIIGNKAKKWYNGVGTISEITMFNLIKIYNFSKIMTKRGFSLTEMSTVMVVIGFIAASALSVAISSDYATKWGETESKLNRIEEALAGYLSINHRLPCPASGTAGITSASFGVEQITGINCTADFNDGVVGNTVWGGVVPVVTLQLPDDFMFDGWGRRIDYAVNNNFANNTTTNPGCASSACFIDKAAGTITVNDASDTAIVTNAVYVLLSHGENGHGAFPKPGSAITTRLNGFPAGNPYRDATASAHEFTNAKSDNSGTNTTYTATFVTRDYTRNDDTTAAASARTYFDDQLRYRTKSQIVKATGAAIYDSVCSTALAIVNNPGANDCTGAIDHTQCETFATEINSRCLQ